MSGGEGQFHKLTDHGTAKKSWPAYFIPEGIFPFDPCSTLTHDCPFN